MSPYVPRGVLQGATKVSTRHGSGGATGYTVVIPRAAPPPSTTRSPWRVTYCGNAMCPIRTVSDWPWSPVLPVSDACHAYVYQGDVLGVFLTGQGIRIRYIALAEGAAAVSVTSRLDPATDGVFDQFARVPSSSISAPSCATSCSPGAGADPFRARDILERTPQTRMTSLGHRMTSLRADTDVYGAYMQLSE